MKYLCFITASFFYFPISFAQSAGDLDLTFGASGHVITDMASSAFVKEVRIQEDGKIVAAGKTITPGLDYDFVVVRYLNNGSLDNSFGDEGIQTIDMNADEDNATAMEIQKDGKILIAGNTKSINGYNLCIVRLNQNGSTDTTFADNGFLIYQKEIQEGGIRDINLQSDNKIIVAGYFIDSTGTNEDEVIMRFNYDGSIDSSFGLNGVFYFLPDEVYVKANCLALQTDGKILVGGSISDFENSDFLLARLQTNGILDTGFNAVGFSAIDLFESIESLISISVQSDGKIIGTGNSFDYTSFSGFGLARWNTDGTIDDSFGIGGNLITEFDFDANEGNDIPMQIAVQTDGKIIVAGGRYDFTAGESIALARYLVNGVLDISFGAGGKVLTSFGENTNGTSLAIQQDGKIVVGGYSEGRFLIARYLSEELTALQDHHETVTGFCVAPNPTQGEIYISYQMSKADTISMYLFDVTGRKLKTIVENEFRVAGNHDQIFVLPKNLSAGNYFIMLQSRDLKVSLQILKD